MKKQNSFNKRIWEYIKYNQQWLGFVVLLVALLYAYIAVLFEPKELLLNIVYAILFIFLLTGLFHAFKNENIKVKTLSFDYLDGLSIIVGVFATYSIVHFFEFSVVLASCLIGLVGHFVARKYEAAIYCGSFAGMVSVALFGFYEVLVLSLICAFIYLFTKPLFSGYGGKLGAIAFMSSLIVHSLFNDGFLVVESNLHLGLLLATTIIGVSFTFYLQHYFKLTAVFASTILSLIFAVIFIYLIPSHLDYVVVFFSASFIGMSSKERFPNFIFVILSGIILGFIYFIFVRYFNGLGGKLGLLALISVIITSGISKLFVKSHMM